MRFQRYERDVTSVTLHNSSASGNSPARLHLADLPRGDSAPTLSSLDTSKVSIEEVRVSGGSCRFRLRVSSSIAGQTSIRASVGGTTLLLPVLIEAPITLPERAGEVGAVARLLIAEARGPSNAQYNAGDARTCMQWMKRVLVNRLANNPAQFNARGAGNLIDIIRAPGQFAGFSNYPAYDQDLATRIQAILNLANNDNDRRQASYRTFVQSALDVASGAPVPDPCATGLYGWRTEESGSPGGRFAVFKTLAGNTFYTLTD